MDQEIDTARQLERAFVVHAQVLGTCPECRRTVVGDVGHGRATVAHTKPHGMPPFMGHVPGHDREPLALEGAVRDEAEVPVAPQLQGADGEERRRHHAGQEVRCGGVIVRREQEGDP